MELPRQPCSMRALEPEYAMPSQAIAAAHNGDTVRIHPGQYFDCAIVRQNDVTIEGVLTEQTMPR